MKDVINLYVMVDLSGSMQDMGKLYIQKKLCRYISQLKDIEADMFSTVEIFLYQWSDEVRELHITDEDITLFAKGASKLSKVIEFIGNKGVSNTSTRFLFLSDGYMATEEIADFKQKLFVTHTVAVGADAHVHNLKNLSSNNHVYGAENIYAAISSIVSVYSEHQVHKPQSTDQIKISKITDICKGE